VNLPNFSIFHFFSDDIKNIFVGKFSAKKEPIDKQLVLF
jgi:hypothetical protein